MKGTKTSPFPLGTRWKWLLRTASLVVAATLAVGLMPGLARADSLDDRRKKLREQISQTQQKVSTASQKTQTATAALAESRQQLATAQAQLEYVQQQLQAARTEEAAMQAKLVVAQKELTAATAEVVQGEAKVAAQEAVIGQAVRGAYQQQTDLTGISMVITAEDTADVASRLQWNTTIFETTASQLDVLQTLQLQLEAAKQRKTEAQATAAANKAAASEQVSAIADLEQMAQTAQSNVTALVAQNTTNQAAASAELAAYQSQLASFQSEDAKVGKLIAARIAADKLAAARRAAAAQAAAGSSGSSSSSSGSSGSTSSWGFSRPSSGYISSPYGMRIDPINGSSSFHSGTDFAAGCGTPIKAARAGTVTDRYYNSSYGNRLIIDHGKINGVYLSSAYNHAERYIVSVGQYVQRGQTIGYIGTTGRSTGCHLHFQIYENGDLANPMRFLS